MLSEKLKNLRFQKKITQQQVAKILRVSQTCYAGWEQGYRTPSLEDIRKLAILFEVSGDFLLEIENEHDSK